jgi:trigger factor
MESVNSVQQRVTVELSTEEVETTFNQVLKGLQQKAKVQGFRPGKAPLNIIKKMYGHNVMADVSEKLINNHLVGALTEQDIRPIATPVIESADQPEQGKEFKFVALIDILPKLEFDDYKGLKIETETYEVKDEQIKAELEQLRKRQAQTKPILDENPIAAAGHVATISHEASLEGQKLSQMDVKDMPVNLGEKELFEDLEKAILGMKVNETKDVDITLPKDFNDQELAGKTLAFKVTLNELKKLELPEINDDFAKDLNFESVQDMREKVTQFLESRAKDMTRQKLEGAILTAILDKHDFDVPPAMVDQVVDSMIKELPHQSEDQGKAALNNPELRQHFRDQARRRTQNTLLLWHVSQKEDIQVTEDDIKAKIEQTLTQMGMPAETQNEAIRKNLEPRVRENLVFEKAMDFLIDSATVSNTTLALPT